MALRELTFQKHLPCARGFADGNYFAGDPSWYSDDTGSIAATVTQAH